MNISVGIAVAAVSCYLLLFLAFLAAEKTRIIRSFLTLLAVFLFWTGGSLMMRLQFVPGIDFWFDISMFGVCLLPFAFYQFVRAYVGNGDHLWWKIWLALGFANGMLNAWTGFYIQHPEAVQQSDGTVRFVYHLQWTIILLFICAGVNLWHVAYLLLHAWRESSVTKRQLQPVLFGIGVLFLGHVGIMLPIFSGIPLDIVSGVINALFLFYALYQRRLFQMRLLVSRGVIHGLSLTMAILIFANFIRPMETYLSRQMGDMAGYDVLLIALIFTMFTLGLSFLIRKLLNQLFLKEETLQAERLREFSKEVSKSLKEEEILGCMKDMIYKCIHVKTVYISIVDIENNNFIIMEGPEIYKGRHVNLRLDSPVINWQKSRNRCILMSELQRSRYYKTIAEKRRQQLQEMEIECIAPLSDGEQLLGLILLSKKYKDKAYTYDDMNLLDSINSIGYIALKNARLYEKAIWEARTDELTGLWNRKFFYEKLAEEWERCKRVRASLVLTILNVDDFKLYNQLYGMEEGDRALKAISTIIKKRVGSHGYVARYSGKEFAIILPGYQVAVARRMADIIREEIASMHRDEKDYQLKILTISGGICAIPEAASSIRELVGNADMAVYSVKQRGKNGIRVYKAGETIQNSGKGEANRRKVYEGYAGTIYALTAAIDAKDHYTFNHSKNVAEYAARLAQAAGMNEEFIELVREAGLLHDIGKIGVAEHVLNKPGKLTKEEYDVMKTHVEYSVGIIRNLPSLDYVIPAVVGHHERYDGRGYPRGIKGKEIPLSARMLCIADSFDAMVSRRSYKNAETVEHALVELKEQAGKQFDPNLVKQFVKLVQTGKIAVPKAEIEPIVS